MGLLLSIEAQLVHHLFRHHILASSSIHDNTMYLRFHSASGIKDFMPQSLSFFLWFRLEYPLNYKHFIIIYGKLILIIRYILSWLLFIYLDCSLLCKGDHSSVWIVGSIVPIAMALEALLGKVLYVLDFSPFFTSCVDLSLCWIGFAPLLDIFLLLDPGVEFYLNWWVFLMLLCSLFTFSGIVCTLVKVQYGCNCITLLIVSFNPPKYLAIVFSFGSTKSHFNMSWSNSAVYSLIVSCPCRLWSLKKTSCL